ncbi:hypothetical protein T492DRAFT_1147996 [Pavlovales sp. CCMP2436]|nr:hypothetical protein T492DRAFT_1147996 [Pavlovales sp. CCMP2436]
MDPGWLLITLALLAQCLLVLLLVLPMPSNAVRTVILKVVHGIWDSQFVRFMAYLVMGVNGVYFYWTVHTMARRGSFFSPVETARTEMDEIVMFRNERNFFITGGNLFLLLVLRRLVDIQDQLRRARILAKEHEEVEKIIKESKKFS